MAFVVIIHLSPDHESSVARLLQEHTTMPVRQVTGRTAIKADHIYIIPPGSLLTLEDGHQLSYESLLKDVDQTKKSLETIKGVCFPDVG